MKVGDLYRRARDKFGAQTFKVSGGVYGLKATASQIYENSIIRQAVFESTEGVNTCVMVFGDVNSGKSQLLIGDSSQPGLIPQAS